MRNNWLSGHQTSDGQTAEFRQVGRQSRQILSSLFSLHSSLCLFFDASEMQNHMKKSFLPLPVPWMCASGMGEIPSGLSASHIYSGE